MRSKPGLPSCIHGTHPTRLRKRSAAGKIVLWLILGLAPPRTPTPTPAPTPTRTPTTNYLLDNTGTDLIDSDWNFANRVMRIRMSTLLSRRALTAGLEVGALAVLAQTQGASADTPFTSFAFPATGAPTPRTMPTKLAASPHQSIMG
jgi:hypothetical protein